MLITNPTYNLKDISIIPARMSYISHRSNCDTFINGNLPVFTAPMSAVVNIENASVWEYNDIIPIIPRNIPYNVRMNEAINNHRWVAMSLTEFRDTFVNLATRISTLDQPVHVLIDVANGHMCQIYTLCRESKIKYGVDKIKIMVGNIANPETYEEICKWSKEFNGKIVDYVRVGIGGGSCCSTTSSTNIHMGLASLINECYLNKVGSEEELAPAIIADGGIRTYNDAITALALGADYVMIGTTFASLFESAAEFQNIKFSKDITDILYRNDEKFHDIKVNAIKSYQINGPIYKRVYGMSTYVAQKEIDSNAKTRLTEGLGRDVKCFKTVKQWAAEFAGYLSSCMSYCNCTTLNDFIGKVECRVMSPNTACGFNSSMDNFVGNELYVIKE